MSLLNNSEPSIINMEALKAKAVGELPSHFQNAWTEIEASSDYPAMWFAEIVVDLEHEVIKAIQRNVIDTVARYAMVDLGIPLQATPAQSTEAGR